MLDVIAACVTPVPIIVTTVTGVTPPTGVTPVLGVTPAVGVTPAISAGALSGSGVGSGSGGSVSAAPAPAPGVRGVQTALSGSPICCTEEHTASPSRQSAIRRLPASRNVRRPARSTSSTAHRVDTTWGRDRDRERGQSRRKRLA